MASFFLINIFAYFLIDSLITLSSFTFSSTKSFVSDCTRWYWSAISVYCSIWKSSFDNSFFNSPKPRYIFSNSSSLLSVSIYSVSNPVAFILSLYSFFNSTAFIFSAYSVSNPAAFIFSSLLFSLSAANSDISVCNKRRIAAIGVFIWCTHIP